MVNLCFLIHKACSGADCLSACIACCMPWLFRTKHQTPVAAVLLPPSCVCRCPSCAAEHREILAAEAAAALTRQFSAPASALRAAAAAAQREGRSVSRQGRSVSRQRQSLQRHSQHEQPALLPALSVVNHATGEHIVISGLDKVCTQQLPTLSIPTELCQIKRC